MYALNEIFRKYQQYFFFFFLLIYSAHNTFDYLFSLSEATTFSFLLKYFLFVLFFYSTQFLLINEFNGRVNYLLVKCRMKA